MTTGLLDNDNSELAPSEGTVPTELCHIIPFSLGNWEKKEEDHQISEIWTTLKRLFPRIGLGPSDINDPTNLMTLWPSAYAAFGDFSLAFEPTGKENEYNVIPLGMKHTHLKRDLPSPDENGRRVITFKNYSDVELPSPDLLQTHAALAKILHASGMAKYLDELVRDQEEIGCLVPAGSTNLEELLLLRALLST
ncbi:hypothetical protein AJ80_03083 [Polytolypa hystricis UAMH7299]|uniref:HNH nuclease domain-containing protein n=1 Tax=Polytolypa hystricis (strain UAMH7299) TaxID=1447883 RepID=A0A2B7YKD0_POLH7|nr:hypothetical protein AJ80_03083 [Polytolypa hystricis UAMH7299]